MLAVVEWRKRLVRSLEARDVRVVDLTHVTQQEPETRPETGEWRRIFEKLIGVPERGRCKPFSYCDLHQIGGSGWP